MLPKKLEVCLNKIHRLYMEIDYLYIEAVPTHCLFVDESSLLFLFLFFILALSCVAFYCSCSEMIVHKDDS